LGIGFFGWFATLARVVSVPRVWVVPLGWEVVDIYLQDLFEFTNYLWAQISAEFGEFGVQSPLGGCSTVGSGEIGVGILEISHGIRIGRIF